MTRVSVDLNGTPGVLAETVAGAYWGLRLDPWLLSPDADAAHCDRGTRRDVAAAHIKR